MAISTYLENRILSATLRGVAYSSPSVVYLALLTSNPTDDNIGTEVSANEYQRRAVTFSEPVNGATTNSNKITFALANSNWGTINYVGVYDSQIGGNLLYYGALGVQHNVVSNSQLVIDENGVSINLE